MSVEKSPKLSRREREMALHRAEILSAAEQVFAESGFVSARMEEIARRAEFSVGMLYKFFKSKEDLYAAILREKSESMRKRGYAELERDVPPSEKIRNIFRVRIDLFWEHWTFFRLFFHETGNAVCDPRAGFTPDVWEQYQAYLRDQEAVFEAGIAAGEFRGPNATALALAFEGIIRAYALRLFREETAERSPEMEEALLEIFMRGALVG